MAADRVDDYLSKLARELRRRHVFEGRIVDEVRHHLEDAVARYLRQGMPVQEAQDHALQDLGSQRRIAAGFASATRRRRHLALALSAVASGALAAFVDSRPNWDDTAIIAGGIFLACLVFGLLGPRRAWLWALCCGLGVPLVDIAISHNFGSLLAVAFAFAGAYTGAAVRKFATDPLA
jgi:hypothetical protein